MRRLAVLVALVAGCAGVGRPAQTAAVDAMAHKDRCLAKMQVAADLGAVLHKPCAERRAHLIELAQTDADCVAFFRGADVSAALKCEETP